MIMTTISRSEKIEAKCKECGAEIVDGCLPYRSLDAFDNDPEPYCPACEGDDLEFMKPKD
jgi:Zn finger protein HypA/HybF involved in hydrogenase expression